MPVETVITRCGNCGATLQRTPGVAAIRCGYCEQTTWLAPTTDASFAAAQDTARPRHAAAAGSLLDRLARGPIAETFGEGARRGADAVKLADPILPERALWPVSAEASSTFGGPWSPSTLIGPPKVYPRYGDISGAWAPGPSTSPAEWIEVNFGADVPVSAVRVFETNQAGSTYAVVDTTHGEELLYARGPEARHSASVLEVALPAPRVIRSLRVFVVNRGWAEIDAVCLMAASPLPEALRTKMPSRRAVTATLLALVGLAACACVAAIVMAVSRGGADGARPALPQVAAALPGAAHAYGDPAPQALMARGATWASAVIDRSSEYSSARNAAPDVLGAPDVYPRSGDLDGAWASRATDGGDEWVTVRFPAPVRASSVLWVETFNPGAVVRVDDVSNPAAPVALWQGAPAAPGTPAAVGEVTLAAPRVISAVRVVLDTRRVSGWNEIDAIGVVPAP